jgi:hypothetical protein
VKRAITQTAGALPLWLFSVALLSLACAPHSPHPAVGAPRPVCDPVALERDVRYLASDDLAGRGLGSQGLDTALHYVAQRFKDLGLEPAFPECADRTDALAAYFQHFKIEGYPASANVIGILPGKSQRSSEIGSAPRAPGAVIVGAHVDHLGRDPNLAGDRIFNGADDNASGVAALLTIARMSTELADNDQALIFIGFSAEESGLLGSQYYTEHPVVPTNSVLAMINLDSVGKLREQRVIVFGMDTAREFPSLIEGVNQARGLDLVEGSRGVEGSDHSSFIAKGIPALHFFTGAHTDFSKITDEADGINYSGLAAVTDYVAELVHYLTYRDRPLTFVARKTVPRPPPLAGQHGQRRVSLGFMPDFAAGREGVKIAQVTPGGAADTAGLQKDDVIIAIDGEAVTSLQDYTIILRQHAPGDVVTVKVARGATEVVVTATLQERK